nr:ORF1 [Ectropis grisescens TED virus]
MVDAAVEQVYKGLRVLPDFDGNPNVLTRFIRLCDQLVEQYVRPEPEFRLSNLSLLNGILNKVVGPAARLLNSNGIPDTWLGIRSALIGNFSDQRNETSLYNDLALLSQGSSSPQEFYDKCQNLLTTIMTYVSLHETVESTIEAKRTLYKDLTLQSYLRGLRDPLGARIRCMRPDTIEQALKFTHEEVNTLYMQQRNEQFTEKKMQVSASSIPLQPLRRLDMPPPLHAPGPYRPTFAQPQRMLPAWRPQGPQFKGPTRTQQMFAAQPPNYRPQSNLFKLPQRNTPMSGVSHYVTKPFPAPARQLHDWSKHGNPPPSNYFKTREMNFNEFYDQQLYNDPQTSYDYYDFDDQDYYDHTDYPYVYAQEHPEYNMESYAVEVNEPEPNSAAQEQDFSKTKKLDKSK